MSRNRAIVIGVNEYQFLQSLRYAKHDAELMREFLQKEATFEQVYFFSDSSAEINGESTRPYRANLLRMLRQMFETPFMQAGDNFWFFFSGHGMRFRECDYLMPSDGDPEDIEHTAIPINYVAERLRGCGADNVVLILDACRNEGSKSGEGVGRQTTAIAHETGVISIFSCSPSEYSYEIEALQQGSFTRALVDGLGIQGQCATVERLNQYLSSRVFELNSQHRKPQQRPYIIAEPVTKNHLILMPQHATLADIALLKTDAFRAQIDQDFDLAKQLWIRVLAAASGQDTEAIEALGKIEARREQVRGQKELDDFYSEASQLYQAQRWQAVIDVFERIYQIDRAYSDPKGLLSSSHKQQNLSNLYRQGKRYINAELWSEALRQFEEIRRLEPGYRDIEDILTWLQQEESKPELAGEIIRKGKVRLPREEVKRMPTQAAIAFWLSLIIIVANIQHKAHSTYTSLGSNVAGAFVVCGIVGGLVDGLITGIASQRVGSFIQWHKVMWLVIVGCVIGFVIWGVAGILGGNEDRNYDYASLSLAIIGAIFCRVILWLFSRQLSRI